MTDRTGGCACGATRFTLTDAPDTAGACHCETCRRWSGGVYMAVKVPQTAVTLTGDAPHIWTSSGWAERASCATCGSALYYRVTLDGPFKGDHHVAFGALDDTSGMRLTEELFVDCRAEAVTLEGGADRHQMTREDVFAMFGGQ